MIRIVKLSFKDEYVQTFLELFEERKERIRQAEGCTKLELWLDEDDAASFITHSHWLAPHYLELYRNSLLFQETWSIVKPWFKHKPIAFSAQPSQVL